MIQCLKPRLTPTMRRINNLKFTRDCSSFDLPVYESLSQNKSPMVKHEIYSLHLDFGNEITFFLMNCIYNEH